MSDRANRTSSQPEFDGLAREADSVTEHSFLDLETDIAPSFPGVFRTTASPDSFATPQPELEDRHGDFEVVRELGRGTSGVVYLARQISLDRQVALKVTRNLGTEAKTMAMLEHRHIVPVYSETLSDDGQLRLICMQYVPGIALDGLIDRLGSRRFDDLVDVESFAAFVQSGDITGDESESESNEGMPIRSEKYVQAVCSLIADVADALAYAHNRGVLHLDVKPANVLIDESGRPMLADFSLALPPAGTSAADGSLFGGTPAYMAPEHLDAFNPEHPAERRSVDVRTDVYSLGLVLYELLTLKPPGKLESKGATISEYCRRLADDRRQPPPPALSLATTRVAHALNWTLVKCLAAKPADRFQTADELARALRGCRQLAEIRDELAGGGWWSQQLDSMPLVGPLLFGTLANLAGVSCCVAYVLAVPSTRTILNETSARFVIWFCVAYSLLAMLINWYVNIWHLRPALCIPDTDFDDNPAMDKVRRRVVRQPARSVIVILLTWLPALLLLSSLAVRSIGDLTTSTRQSTWRSSAACGSRAVRTSSRPPTAAGRRTCRRVVGQCWGR